MALGTQRKQLITGYRNRLLGYAIGLTGDRARAEDLVQEVMAKALAARRVPRDEPDVRAWLFRILRNQLVDDDRRHDRWATSCETVAGPAQPVDWRHSEQIISVLTVRLALDRLPAMQREIIALIDFNGLSYAETADIVGVPAGTVMRRLSRARRALAQALGASNVRPLKASGGDDR